MALNGLNWTPLTLPFSGSLEQKTDARVASSPDLDLARDVQFEEIGGLQTRAPFTAMSRNIFGGGTLSNCRRLGVVNGELCVFTDTQLYSWNAQQAAWVLRGTHLAVSVSETPRFVTTGDQIDGDRAELNGTVVFAWTENGQVYASAIDKVTGSVLVTPTAVSTAIGRPRLVALSTKILLFVEASTTLLTVRAIDPAAPGTAISGAGTTVLATNFNLYFDVVKAGTQDLVVGACRRVTTTSYTIFTVTPALVVTTATPARTCDGPIAVATIADGTKTQVIRGNGTNVEGDLITTSTLVDVFTAQAIGTAAGTPINQITAEFSSTTCTAFWSFQEVADASNTFFGVRTNTVTTANVVGTASTLVLRLGVASRAFAHGGSIYVWLAFAEDSTTFGSGSPLGIRAQLQNTYFLYRADGTIASKATWQVAGGYSPSTGHLPGVTAVTSDSYAWASAWRRQIALGDNIDHTGYSARSLRDVAFAFDDNTARRTTVLGRTMYVSGGTVSQFDGASVVELGFNVYPWAFAASDALVGGNPDGTYSYKSTLRWKNAQGEVERSTTATGEQVTVTTNEVNVSVVPLYVTMKTATAPNIEVWRTESNAGEGAAYYLITGQDPNTTTGENFYLKNLITLVGTYGLVDNFSDATLVTKEANPENDGVLESLAPPGGKILVPTENRMFLTGLSDDPDGVWPSRLRGDGEIVSFHDALRFSVPPAGGAITALWVDDQFVYVARETAIYAFTGPGIANDGTGQNYTLVRTISRDVGVVSQEAHAPTPVGRILKSSKGWYVLDGSGALRYIGDAISSFDTDTVLAMHTITAKHQVRILTSGRLLLWDYRALIDATNQGPGRWAEWTVADGLDAVMWGGSYVYLTSTGPKQEQAALTGLTYAMDVRTKWIKPADLMGSVAVRRVQPLGEFRSAHLLRLRMAYNYDETIVDDVIWSPSPTTVGGPLQLQHGPKRPRCQAVKIRITAVAAGVQATLATSSGLSHVVSTSGTNWAATWAAKTGSNLVIGELGNLVTMSITFATGTPNVIDVRDNFRYDATTGLWAPLLNNVGVRVTCAAGSLTVAALEAAIAAASTLVQVSVADATPAKTIDATGMNGLSVTGTFTGGTFTSPTGEALKLSGLGLEVGLERGLYKRLPAAQKA
jgi:hypothetical protein